MTVPHEKVHLGSAGSRIAVGGFLVAIVGFAVAVIYGVRQAGTGAGAEQMRGHFWHAYLWAFSFFLAITLGALFFVMMHHLARAGWSVLVRRIAEALASNMALMLVLFVPFLYLAATDQLPILYEWASPHAKHDKLLAGKAAYLSVTPWLVRLVGFLVVWTGLAFYMRKNSIAQDTDGDVERSKKMETISAPGLLFFGVSLTLAGIDLLMSLNPHWFSTMFGVTYFANCALAFFSTVVLITLALQKRGMLGNLVNAEHFHDLGKWMFAFTFFWGYVTFSQYMLIWYAGLPEETQYFLPRQIGVWGTLSILLLVAHLLIPFPGLLSRHVKRKMPVLAFWAVWSLLGCVLDIFYMVMPHEFISKIPEVVREGEGLSREPSLQDALPKLVEGGTEASKHGIYALGDKYHEFMGQVTFPLTDAKAWVVSLGMFVGMAGLYVAATMWFLKGASLVPLKDPRLPESLAHENI